jgi:hypothetical protein
VSELTIGDKVMLYDEPDQTIVDRYKWHLSTTGYAVWRGVKDGEKQTIRLHRLINNTPDGMFTDHINHNRLDNRRENLRTVTASENMRNLTDQGKGYYFDNRKRRWVIDCKRIHGVKSVMVDSEQAAIEYVNSLRQGKPPTRLFTPRYRDRSVLTDDEKVKVFEFFEDGIPRYKIAAIFKVSPSCIGRLLDGTTGKLWRTRNGGN